MKEFLKAVTTQYADFRGRMSRRDFWAFFLCFFLLSVIAGVFFPPKNNPLHIFWLCFFITPFIAAQVRRLHDAAIPGEAVFLLFFPPLNLALFAFLCLPSTDTNRFGTKNSASLKTEKPAADNDVITLSENR